MRGREARSWSTPVVIQCPDLRKSPVIFRKKCDFPENGEKKAVYNGFSAKQGRSLRIIFFTPIHELRSQR